jgi:hypothetical protein
MFSHSWALKHDHLVQESSVSMARKTAWEWPYGCGSVPKADTRPPCILAFSPRANRRALGKHAALISELFAAISTHQVPGRNTHVFRFADKHPGWTNECQAHTHARIERTFVPSDAVATEHIRGHRGIRFKALGLSFGALFSGLFSPGGAFVPGTRDLIKLDASFNS